jgi:hypothetical protein
MEATLSVSSLLSQLLWYGHPIGGDSADAVDPWAFQHRLVGHASVTAQVALPADDPNLTWRLNANVTDMDPDAKAVLVGGSNDNRTPATLPLFVTFSSVFFSQFWTSDFL